MYIVWILKTFSFHSIIIIIFPLFSRRCCYCCELFTVAVDSSGFPRTCTCTKHYRGYITLSNRLSAVAGGGAMFVSFSCFYSCSIAISLSLGRASNRAFKIISLSAFMIDCLRCFWKITFPFLLCFIFHGSVDSWPVFLCLCLRVCSFYAVHLLSFHFYSRSIFHRNGSPGNRVMFNNVLL